MSAQPTEYDSDNVMDSEDEAEERRTVKDREESAKKRRRIDLEKRNWFLTENNYVKDNSITRILGITGLIRYQIQEEICPTTGTPHLQGVTVFRYPKKWSTLDNHCNHKVVWKPCRSIFRARIYCSKERTRAPNGQQWSKGFEENITEIKDPIEGKQLYDWQKKVIEIVAGPVDDRKIYWYWSNKGGIGKSALVKHICMVYGASVSGGNAGDAHYAISQMVKAKKPIPCIIFDIPRASRNEVTYSGIEGIKNGLFFSSKYESGMVMFNSPHVIVMANQEPDWGMMSRDRWVVQCLDNEHDLRHIPGQYNFNINRN